MGWTKSMPFASINSTNPRTHPAQFGKKILRIDRLAKWGFFESAILDFFFRKKKIFFCLIPWKIVKGSWTARMGRNFDDFPGFQPFRSWANTYAQDCSSFCQSFLLNSCGQWSHTLLHGVWLHCTIFRLWKLRSIIFPKMDNRQIRENLGHISQCERVSVRSNARQKWIESSKLKLKKVLDVQKWFSREGG